MDIDHIVSLIETFNNSHDSKIINEIQHVLQEHQKSDHGIALANALLAQENASPNVMYFGALTYTVQLISCLHNENQLWIIFRGNLIHLTRMIVRYTSNPDGSSNLLVAITKLMSNLSFIFLTVNSEASGPDSNKLPAWRNPVNTCLKLLQHCNESNLQEWNTENSEIFERLIPSCLNEDVQYAELIKYISSSAPLNKLLLLFTRVIVEDLNKFQSKKNSLSNVYEMVHNHLYISTMAILNFNLENMTSSSTSSGVFPTITSWIHYISMARNVSAHGNMDLTEMFSNMINIMCITNNGSQEFPYSEQVISIFDDLFSDDPTLLSFEARAKLEAIFLGVSRHSVNISNDWMMSYMNHLVTSESFDDLKVLASCVVDFLQISNLDVCNKLFTNIHENSGNESLEDYIKVLLQLTNFPLVPILQETYSSKMVEFWLDLAEGFGNLPQESLKANASEIAENMFNQVVQIYLPKISLMNKQRIMEEDDDQSLLHEFDDFRSATQDMIEILWAILGHSKLTIVLIRGVGQADTNVVDLYQVEAMSFLLAKLLDGVAFSQSPFISDAIGENKLIDNLLFLLQTGCKQKEQSKTAQVLKLDFVKATCNLLGVIATYFQVDSKPLGPIVELLFECLETSRQYNTIEYSIKMELQLNKTLSLICENCRKELVPFLPNFILVLRSIMLPESPISHFTKEKFVKSVGNIIQMCVSEGPESQASHISSMVDMIGSLIQDSDVKSDTLSLLHCLSELGSGLSQLPDDEEFLESNPMYVAQLPAFQTYWQQDPMRIRDKVMHLVQYALSKYGRDPEFVEVSCLLIGKAISLPEDIPHFLRYPLTEVISFLVTTVSNCDYPSALPFIEYQLEKIVSRFKDAMTPHEFDEMFRHFFIDFYSSHISIDPDLVQSMVSWVNSVLESKPSLALHSQYWSQFIIPEFLKLLQAKEKFTITSITKFWTKILNNRKYTQEDTALVNSLFESIGKQLVYQTMFSLYHAQRSDVPPYAELIRTLFAKYPLPMKDWLFELLPQITDKPAIFHERFINKLSVTRASRATSATVLEWWLDCNGLPTM
ncbi:unnamed protein product [Kluyveromyces dobzhanskii CBS 2104]|uniref:WGS project CCBQ000000000 data, contig 00058 n=1 Tax=Kluyveromyces dobzhanskii CBS 2104 TaxID=1427455 RepID=A0A0A8LB17_9SACH|nr:unnamed protein product [Kluyveromyces dobzhanskii CBS 2104]